MGLRCSSLYLTQLRSFCLQGDASEAFKFSGFLPTFLAPVIDAVAAALSFVFRLKHAPAQESQSTELKGGASMLGSDAVDANRRRCGVVNGCKIIAHFPCGSMHGFCICVHIRDKVPVAFALPQGARSQGTGGATGHEASARC